MIHASDMCLTPPIRAVPDLSLLRSAVKKEGHLCLCAEKVAGLVDIPFISVMCRSGTQIVPLQVEHIE